MNHITRQVKEHLPFARFAGAILLHSPIKMHALTMIAFFFVFNKKNESVVTSSKIHQTATYDVLALAQQHGL